MTIDGIALVHIFQKDRLFEKISCVLPTPLTAISYKFLNVNGKEETRQANMLDMDGDKVE